MSLEPRRTSGPVDLQIQGGSDYIGLTGSGRRQPEPDSLVTQLAKGMLEFGVAENRTVLCH